MAKKLRYMRFVKIKLKCQIESAWFSSYLLNVSIFNVASYTCIKYYKN